MSIKANIIKGIEAHLLLKGAAEKVDRFNEQILHDEKESYKRTAVFIEFNDILWTPYNKGSQQGVFLVGVHIILDDFAKDLDKFFDPIEKVHQFLQGFRPTAECGKMDRMSEVDDNDHERLADWVAFYKFNVKDESGDIRNQQQSGIVTLEITKCIDTSVIVTPIQGSNNKILTLIYEEGGDNEVEFEATVNQSGTYQSINGTNTDVITVEVDTGGGFNVVAVPFVVQPTNKVKVTIDRTDDSLQSVVTIQGQG